MKSLYVGNLITIIFVSIFVLISGLLAYQYVYLKPELPRQSYNIGKAIKSPVATEATKDRLPAPNSPFFVNHIVGSSTHELALSDLPSTSQLNNFRRNIVRYRDRIFVNDDYSHILEFSQNGQLVAISDPNILHGCLVSEIAVINDRLYLGCSEKGLYIIDLVSGSFLKAYTPKDGLNALNIQLVPTGDQLWIGTFDGVYRFDTVQDKLFAYKKKELQSGCEMNGSEVMENQGDVWVVITAHNQCSGGVAHYMSTTDSWKFFGLTDFQTHQDRIDFNHFYLRNNELFAEFNDQDVQKPEVRKYDKTSDSWTAIKDTAEPVAYALKNLLPRVARNLGYTVQASPTNNKNTWYEVSFSDGFKTRLPQRTYKAISPSSAGYWIVGTDGLEIFNATTGFPGKYIIAKINLDPYDSVVMLTSKDAREVFIISFSQGEYDGRIYYYNIFAFGLPDFETALEKRFPGDTFALKDVGKIIPDFRRATLQTKNDGTYSIKDESGDTFSINPTSKTIRAILVNNLNANEPVIDAITGWTTYHSSACGISYTIPPGWVSQGWAANNEIINLSNPNDLRQDEINPRMSDIGPALPSTSFYLNCSSDIASFIDDQETTLVKNEDVLKAALTKGVLKHFKIAQYLKTTEVSGQKAFVYEIGAADSHPGMHYDSVFVYLNNRWMEIRPSMTRFADMTQDQQGILDSIKTLDTK